MTDVILTQAEAETLLAMEKHCIDEQRWDYPGLGQFISIPLVSSDGRENFLLDLRRGRIDLLKVTYQNRARHTFILARLDLGGPPHQNPDGQPVACPHLRLYSEGLGDKWAIPAPPEAFSNLISPWVALEDFMRYCNVTRPPVIRMGGPFI